jgi:hypothetical protein
MRTSKKLIVEDEGLIVTVQDGSGFKNCIGSQVIFRYSNTYSGIHSGWKVLLSGTPNPWLTFQDRRLPQ